MQVPVGNVENAIARPISEDEVTHFHEKGWVLLRGFLNPRVVDGLHHRATSRMGADPVSVSRETPDERIENEYNWYARWDGCSHADDWIRAFSHREGQGGLAAVAARLIGGQVRFYFDHVFTKRPAVRQGSETPWHQDLPHHPLDRQGVLTMWMPLLDCAKEMGTLRFLNGSHRSGILGRYLNRNDGISLIDENPWVLDRFEMSEPVDMRVGDISIHDLSVIHYAPENQTSSPRWVYACQWLPAATRFTGADNHRTDGVELTVDQPFDHPRFPIIPT